MITKVKICGIKTIEAAQAASSAGADFLGFNFVPASKRFISAENAAEIINALPKEILKVGIFMNADITEVNKFVNDLELNYVQLHGDESPEYLSLINGAQIIKTFSLVSEFNLEETIEKMRSYRAEYLLLDREVQGQGELLNIEKVKQLSSIFPTILSGGLTIENVAEAVRIAKPQVVDVAGGVETNSEKDEEKIKVFIQEAKKYDI